MSIEDLKTRIPDHAKDIRINLGIIAGSTALTAQQAWGTAVAAAVTSRSPEVLAAVLADAAPHLTPEAIAAAKAAAAIMGMNNIYYRFTHTMGEAAASELSGEQVPLGYHTMPARLRMQIIGRPGVDLVDFELWCLASSAITGCARCVQSHEKAVRERGGTKEAVQDSIRIAAVVHASSIALATG